VSSSANLDGRTKLRQQDMAGDCTRNGEKAFCGVYFPVTDYLGKPVLLLDQTGLVAGVADYEPFGHVNRVTYVSETPHPGGGSTGYSAVNGAVLGYFTQPVSPLSTILRARYSTVRTSSASDYAVLTDWNSNQQLAYGFGGTNPPQTKASGLSRAQVSDWVQVPADGHLHARFYAQAASTHPGVGLEAYEYRRFQTGTQPAWLPLRFPGQYHDAETDLFQNFNRFYDAQTGRYLEAEPLWSQPRELVKMEIGGSSNAIYGYAGNNPLHFADPDALEVVNGSDREIIVKPDTDSTVTIRDASGSERQLDVKAGDAVTIQPGETFAAPQDGLADPGMRGSEVLKTVDGVNATVNQDGSITLSFDPNQTFLQDVKSAAGQVLIGGWKNDVWNNQLNAKGDQGWNNIFNAATTAGGYTVHRWP